MNFTFGSNLQVFRGFNLRSDKSFDNFQFLVAIWAMNVYFLKVLFFHSPDLNWNPQLGLSEQIVGKIILRTTTLHLVAIWAMNETKTMTQVLNNRELQFGLYD